MRVSATVKNNLKNHMVIVNSSNKTQNIAISGKKKKVVSAVSGGELLAAALATCFCNDLYREAVDFHIDIKNVSVEASCEFSEIGAPAYDFSYKADIVADATDKEIEALIQHTDRVAEIHNTLRNEVEVVLDRS